jgi:hypothetical protein
VKHRIPGELLRRPARALVVGGLLLSLVLAVLALWRMENRILLLISISLNVLLLVAILVTLIKIGTG